VKIVFKLYAQLTDYLPNQGRDQKHEIDVELHDGATVAHVIERFALPEKLLHLVLVNGVYIPPDQRLSRVLREGDALAIWPQVAGG
jgi:sulfur carrier protein ThiS